MRKRSDLFPKKYKRPQRLHNFSSWQELLHPVYDMWWLMYHHDYWYGGWNSTWFKSSGAFCHHFTVLVAFSATTFPFWWHFPPPWLFHSDLSGGAFCRHFAVLTAFFATTFPFWRHFLPPHCFSSDLSGGAFCPHFVVLGALFAPIFMFWRRFLPPH